MTEDELQILRRAFARQIVAVAGAAGNARLEAAFAEVRRERFLGSDPWMIVDVMRGPMPLPTNDPVYAYQDVLFTLSQSRGVNNGAPSLHARLLHALSPEPGHSVVHLGSGGGYYTAMLAELVGPGGRVTAVEVDPVLARMARDTLSDRPNIDVAVADGAAWPQEDADRIYVNYGVAAPAEAWIERLAPAGRLVVPLSVPGQPRRPGGPRFAQHGAAFLIERRDSGLSAAFICPAYFVHGDDDPAATDEGALERLRSAFRSGGAESVRSLVWRRTAEGGRCWFWSPEWSLSYDPA